MATNRSFLPEHKVKTVPKERYDDPNVDPADADDELEEPKRGEPVKLDRRLIQTVERALRDKLPIKRAAWMAGISNATLSAWLREGEQEGCQDQIKRELFQRCAVALGKQTRFLIRKHLDLIEAGGAGSAAVLRNLSAAIDPEVFGQSSTQKVEVTHNEVPADRFKHNTLEEKREIRRLMLAGLARGESGGGDEDAEG